MEKLPHADAAELRRVCTQNTRNTQIFWTKEHKNIFYSHTERTEYTETLLRMLFSESLRRLRETIPLRMALV